MSVRARETHGFFVGRHGDMRQLQQPVKKIYRAWVNMKDRCYNQSYKGYANYGGRGIVVCQRWLESFEDFMADVGVPPSEQHSLGRKETNGNYEPSNCRWETRIQQGRNKRNNVLIAYHGETLCISEWATRTGLSRDVISKRLKNGKTSDDLFCRPHRWSRL